jgi:alkylation response protein AidB-like acyl-CoA dehydrogenase
VDLLPITAAIGQAKITSGWTEAGSVLLRSDSRFAHQALWDTAVQTALAAAAAILEEIHASGCNAGPCHAQMYIMGTLLRHGSTEQKERYLPKIASGELRLQAFGVTEPTTGTDTTQLKTRAVREGDHYVVHGQKVWTSRALHSDLMLLLARTTPADQVKKKTDGLSVFLVDIRDSLGHGLEIKPLKAMINHHATEVFFDGMKVPAANLIGEEGKGFHYILHGLNPERVLIAAEAIGLGRAALARATQYARDRVVFGRPIGQNQGIQHPLAKCWAELEAADLLVWKAASMYDAGQECGAFANAAKYLAGEAGFHACETAVLTHGGMGYAKEYHVERYFREVMITRIAPVSRELVLSYLAERVLGLPKSY